MAELVPKRAGLLNEQEANLSDFVREHKEKILRTWKEIVSRRFADALREPEPLLIDHLPELLERIGEVLARRGSASTALISDASERHALVRLAEGRDLTELIEEYGALRSVIFELWQSDSAYVTRAFETRLLNEVIDCAIVVATTRYAKARERTLDAIDRVAGTVGANGDPNQLIDRLLQAVLDTTEAVDSVGLFLRTSEMLEPRAWHETNETNPDRRDAAAKLATDITVLAKPKEISSVEGEPSESTLYGVPLVQGDRAIGVLVMGSRTCAHFSDEDKALLRLAASHATAYVIQAQLAEAGQDATKRAEEAKRHAGEFAEVTSAMLGHDLRNPLNIITLGASALKASQNLDEKQQKNIQRIEDHAQRMARMISDFLDLTRSRLGGGIPINPRPIDFHQITRGVLEALETAQPGRVLRLRTDGVLLGRGDPDRIAQVITNLVMNALQYSPDESPVDIALKEMPSSIELSVHNMGDPIPSDLLPHIFEPFRRGKSARREKKAYSGLGLGLFIVDQIARAHAGTVTVRSSPGEGTTFVVSWPK
jgi:signal transduction histidine kinase